MTKYKIKFFMNNIAEIMVPLKDPIEFLGPLYQEHILFVYNKQKITISKSTIYHNMLHLSDLLKKALNHKLCLDPFITQNIGVLHNEYLYKGINFSVGTLPNDGTDWIGYAYHLWQARKGLTSFDSWIYNNFDGSIIFEITPIYPYLFSEPEEEPDYIPYEEWIKTYKPYFTTILSRETALQWLDQAEHIIKVVEFNQKRWDLRLKKDVKS